LEDNSSLPEKINLPTSVSNNPFLKSKNYWNNKNNDAKNIQISISFKAIYSSIERSSY
jgi:hypothetical protein